MSKEATNATQTANSKDQTSVFSSDALDTALIRQLNDTNSGAMNSRLWIQQQ